MLPYIQGCRRFLRRPPAHHARTPSRPSHHAKQPHRGRRPSRWVAATAALLLLLAAAALLYRRAPLAAPQQAGSEEEQRDSEAELALLHEQPSAAFCARPAPPLVCAHGGDVAAAPPNTAAAFEAALAGGARCVEVDVARTRDGQLAVLHSRELAHLLRLAGRAPRAARRGAHPPALQVAGAGCRGPGLLFHQGCLPTRVVARAALVLSMLMHAGGRRPGCMASAAAARSSPCIAPNNLAPAPWAQPCRSPLPSCAATPLSPPPPPSP